ncbi:hypothetical protein CERSUDRAFT_118472 [Gelatoporia subvermispora B]|uniref:F-box domain-containing protein n=1 Tax=Ceriporiopsis subvermispora (strain B) TaxID=914234 RepID=M2R3B7_CERS8|nr:hypothetical protein CERSUDRAFT_118472 [Gelatoporia subvermispora B]
MDRLPPELWREMLQHVTVRKDLYALSATCRALNPEAEFFLYKDVECTTRSSTREMCALFVDIPRTCPLVRSLKIIDEVGVRIPDAEEYWQCVAAALRILPRLETLKILNSSTQTPTWIFSNCSFSLNELHCDFTLDATSLSFLQAQRHLLFFRWANTRLAAEEIESIPEEADFLPSLQKLEVGSPYAALRLMTGHQLTHVWVERLREDTDEVWQQYTAIFGSSSTRLRSLRMIFPFGKRTVQSVLTALARDAPALRSLGFLSWYHLQDKEMVDTLAMFKSLRSVVSWGIVPSDAVHALAKACPTLRVVACLHYSYSHEYVVMPVNPKGVPRPLHDPENSLWRDA